MKDTDKKILKHLRTNARNSITNISRATNIPTSTVFLKIKEHENNFIKKHTCLLDYSKLGFNHWQQIVIKLAEYYNGDFEKYLLDHKNVNSVYEINGGYDYMIETVHENVKEYTHFIRELEQKFKLADKFEIRLINDLKRESFMANTRENENISESSGNFSNNLSKDI